MTHGGLLGTLVATLDTFFAGYFITQKARLGSSHALALPTLADALPRPFVGLPGTPTYPTGQLALLLTEKVSLVLLPDWSVAVMR
jgi:hypothetical protein